MEVVSSDAFYRANRDLVYTPDGEPNFPEEWDYETPPSEFDFLDQAEIARREKELIGVSPSQFVEFALRVPDKVTQTRVPFSFSGRRYLRLPYDTQSRRTLFKCGRQVEKSTLLGNKCIAYCCIISSFNVLYVSPTNQQTKTFSMDRLKEPIETSDIAKAWTTTKLSDSVFTKQFINLSKISLRYAYHSADRVRGIPADMILIDELQDIITDNIPVIEECASHSPYKLFTYSGTPKSLNNAVEKYWTDFSTQNEWVVPCEHHGVPGDPSTWFWNVLGEENIGSKGLICSSCHNPIFSMHPQAQWASMNPSVKTKLKDYYEGFRIPQLMVPWLEWHEILDKQRKLDRSVFFNEVLGLSYDSGTRPLTKRDIMDNCKTGLLMRPDILSSIVRQLGGASPIFCGIDWGTGEGTYSVLSLGAYIDSYFTIFYIHRFEGPEVEPSVQLDLVDSIISGYNVAAVGADYGGGFDRNDHLMRKFGSEKIFKYQYSTPSQKVRWEPKLRRFLVHRTEVMSDIFNAIKRRSFIRFPDWSQFEDPFSKDMLNIFSEYNEQQRQIEYKKSIDVTDDSFHSILLCCLASMLKLPRFDILNPTQRTQYAAEED
jgi:Phage terminase large subunit (GpA)